MRIFHAFCGPRCFQGVAEGLLIGFAYLTTTAAHSFEHSAAGDILQSGAEIASMIFGGIAAGYKARSTPTISAIAVGGLIVVYDVTYWLVAKCPPIGPAYHLLTIAAVPLTVAGSHISPRTRPEPSVGPIAQPAAAGAGEYVDCEHAPHQVGPRPGTTRPVGGLQRW